MWIDDENLLLCACLGKVSEYWLPLALKTICSISCISFPIICGGPWPLGLIFWKDSWDTKEIHWNTGPFRCHVLDLCRATSEMCPVGSWSRRFMYIVCTSEGVNLSCLPEAQPVHMTQPYSTMGSVLVVLGRGDRFLLVPTVAKTNKQTTILCIFIMCVSVQWAGPPLLPQLFLYNFQWLAYSQ